MRRLLIAAALLMFLRGAAAADLEGRITDAQTGEPLADVNILIEGTRIGAGSNASGYFKLTGVPNEIITLSAGHVGYKIFKTEINPFITNSIDIELQPTIIEGENVTVTVSRADWRNAPASFSNISREQVKEKYHGQELPLLLESLPGVYAYSDAGSGQGYSYLKIRGFDQKRVSVMINGIPLNDPEDHQVYWVDMPDLAANVDDIQVQRGIGYSPYGHSSFGGSVNLITTPSPQERRLEASFGYGSFNTSKFPLKFDSNKFTNLFDTRKFSLLFNSGVVDNTYQVYGRFSRITSDGYRDHSGFEGWSYYLSATRYGLKNTLTLNLYGGPELLQASWDATPEDILKNDRTYNPTYESYDHTIDNFNQPHYELHYSRELSNNMTLHNTLFYIHGEGYWEIKKTGWDEDWNEIGVDLFDYGLADQPATFYSPLVQQQWVNKDQWGYIPRLVIEKNKWDLTFGGNFNTFHSHHWGIVPWVENPPDDWQPRGEDHDFNGDILTLSAFSHASFRPTPELTLTGGLQFRHLEQEFAQNRAGAFSGAQLNEYKITHDFIDPKAGASYKINDNLLGYISLGYSQREPSQREYWPQWTGPEDFGVDPLFAGQRYIMNGLDTTGVEWSDPLVDSEELTDLEIGARWQSEGFKGSLNLYWMDYRNEVIPGGGMNQGYNVAFNAEKTLHRGVEAEFSIKPLRLLGELTETDFNLEPLNRFEIYGNLSYALNTFEDDFFDSDTNLVYESGNTIPLFPGFMARLRASLDYDSPDKWAVRPSIGASYIGKQYLESMNNESATIDPYFLLDFQVDFSLKSITGLSKLGLKLTVNNLLDEEYETSGYYYYYGNYYYPGASRNYFLEMTVGL